MKKGGRFAVDGQGLRKGGSYALYALRRSPLSLIGILLVAIIMLVAIFAPWIAPYSPYKISMQERYEPPSFQHLAGTDSLGRDVFSRVVHGSRISLRIAVTAVSISLTIGVVLGALAGFYGGILDMVIMRITDGFLAIPSFVLALVAAAVFGPSLVNLIWAISLVMWTWNARIVRAAVLGFRSSEFILIQNALGSPPLRTIAKHIIPNCSGPILVQASLQFGLSILTSAGLSFLGVGVQPPLPDWGLMVAEGRQFLPGYWWLVTFPGLAIFLLVAGFLLMGDGLRDVIEREVS
ncbi:ABC transporter permease [Candidatus Bipolaricaulota bacterium]